MSIIKFDEYVYNISNYDIKDVEEVIEKLTYMKYYLNNDELVFDDDTKDFKSKLLNYNYKYSK